MSQPPNFGSEQTNHSAMNSQQNGVQNQSMIPPTQQQQQQQSSEPMIPPTPAQIEAQNQQQSLSNLKPPSFFASANPEPPKYTPGMAIPFTVGMTKLPDEFMNQTGYHSPPGYNFF